MHGRIFGIFPGRLARDLKHFCREIHRSPSAFCICRPTTAAAARSIVKPERLALMQPETDFPEILIFRVQPSLSCGERISDFRLHGLLEVHRTISVIYANLAYHNQSSVDSAGSSIAAPAGPTLWPSVWRCRTLFLAGHTLIFLVKAIQDMPDARSQRNNSRSNSGLPLESR